MTDRDWDAELRKIDQEMAKSSSQPPPAAPSPSRAPAASSPPMGGMPSLTPGLASGGMGVYSFSNTGAAQTDGASITNIDNLDPIGDYIARSTAYTTDTVTLTTPGFANVNASVITYNPIAISPTTRTLGWSGMCRQHLLIRQDLRNWLSAGTNHQRCRPKRDSRRFH